MINLFVSLSKRRGRWRFLLAAALATAALGLWECGWRPPVARSWTTSTSSATCSASASASSSGTRTGSCRWRAGWGRWSRPRRCSRGSRHSPAGGQTRGPRPPHARPPVVLGLGDRGIRIATALAAAGRDVAAVEIDPTETGVGILRHRDGRVVEGDARLHHQLEAAGVPTASAVVVVCGSDATNAEVVASISDLERAPDAGPLNAAVHLSDAGLCALMRHQSLRTATRGVRFDFFDVYSAGARLFLSYHPLADAANGGTPHLMIVGVGQFGRCLLEAAARRRRTATRRSRSSTATPTRGCRRSCSPSRAWRSGRIDAVDIDLDRPGRDASERLRPRSAQGVTTVAVCFDDDARAVTTALLIRRLLGTAPTQVIARTSGTGGLSLLLGQGATAAGVTPFPLLERACTQEIVEGGAHEQVARALHADYTDRTAARRTTSPWDELPPDVQESNRRQADALAAALAPIGCDLVPLGGWGVSHVELTPDEVEALAQREHERWRAERAAAGWRYGPQRDNAQRLNPLLVPWEELPEARRRTAARRRGGSRRCSRWRGSRCCASMPYRSARPLLRRDDPEAHVERVADERDPPDARGVERRDLDAAAQLDRPPHEASASATAT